MPQGEFFDSPCCEDFFGGVLNKANTKPWAVQHGRDLRPSVVNAGRRSAASKPAMKTTGATLVERIDNRRLFSHRKPRIRLDRISRPN